jgi:hypothetical protein
VAVIRQNGRSHELEHAARRGSAQYQSSHSWLLSFSQCKSFILGGIEEVMTILHEANTRIPPSRTALYCCCLADGQGGSWSKQKGLKGIL